MNQSSVTYLRFLLSIFGVLLLPDYSSAHSPHHVITDVAASPANSTANRTYILIADQIFRSDETGASWKNLVNGLNNQYAFTSIGISPAFELDKTLFVSSGGDGVYRSTDSGESWRKINAGIGKTDIAKLSVSGNFSTDHRLMAASKSGGVWRSVDGGSSWHMVLTEVVRIVDFAESSKPNGNTFVFAGDTSGNIWRSDDNGRLWEIIFELPEDVAITSIAGTVEHLYVGTAGNGLYRSTDSGKSFTEVEQLRPTRQTDCRGKTLPRSIEDSHISAVKVVTESAGKSRILVTTRYGGVFVSADNGQSWEEWHSGLSCDPQADGQRVPHYRGIATTHAQGGAIVFWLAAFDGLFRSEGAGSGWQQLETLPLGLIKGLAVSGGPNQPPAIAISTYGGGFYLTENRGSSWTIGNRGLLTTRLTGLTFSPGYSKDGVIYAGAIRRLLRSSDRGQSWERINLQETGLGQRIANKLVNWGLPAKWFGSSDRRRSSPVYPTHILALPGEPAGRVLFATRKHGVLAFDESSGSIDPVWFGTDQVINSLVISPEFEKDHTLFSSIRGQGVFRSEDSGITWVSANDGIAFVKNWADRPGGGDFRRDVVVAIAPDFSADHTLYAGSPAGDGLYISRNSGDSWERTGPEGTIAPAPVLAIAVSPGFRVDNSLIVSIRGQGMYRSVDRGQHFEAIGDALMIDNVSIELLEYSPDFVNDHSIIAASDEQLFISEDAGESWSEISRPVRYEDMRDVVKFDGEWEQRSGDHYSAMTETVSSVSGSRARLQFVGAGIRVLGSCGPEHGTAQVYIDGQPVEDISCWSGKPEYMQELFIEQGLDFGRHMIEVRLTSGIVGVDAFDVLPIPR